MAKDISTTIVLKVSGKQAVNSFSGLSQEVRKLERELKKLTPGTKEFIQKAAEVKEARRHFEGVKREVDLVNGKLKESPGFISKMTKGMLDFGSVAKNMLTLNLFDFIGNKAKNTATELLEIADAMTAVEKTSGMSLEQVKNLWDEFDKMDTRTSKKERLKIGEIAGRLNVPHEEMASFIQEVDKAYVALGDSFEGGLETVVTQLGKIKGLFNETKTQSYAEAINGVGSALNELAASGTSSEGNIADFTMRVGALPDAVKPAIDKVMGLGAALEESGIDSQIGASGFSNFMKVAGQNIDLFAQSMQISKKEAEELMNTKPEEFFLKFAEGMRGVSGTETAKIFESLKINSLEVQKVVGAAANNTEKFREQMLRAGDAVKEATSLNNEFNNVNNNAPAIWEKIKNAIADTFTSTNAINFFEYVIKALGWLTGVTKEASDGVLLFTKRLRILWQIISVVAAAFVGYNSVLLVTTKTTWLSIVADKAKLAVLTLKRVAILLYNVALGLVTLNLKRATAAIIAFNAASKLSPWGVIVGLIGAVVVAYQMMSKEIDEATRKQKMLNDITSETNKSVISQKTELESLIKVAKDETASKTARLEAIKKLNQISPEYLGFLNLENINTQEATKALNAYTDSIYKNARAKVLDKKLQEKIEQKEDLKKQSVVEAGGEKDLLWKATGGLMKLTSSEARNLDKDMMKQMQIWTEKGGRGYAEAQMKIYGSYYEAQNQQVQKINDDISYLQNEIVDLMKSSPEIINPTTNIAIPTSSTTKKNKPATSKNTDKEDIRKSQSAAEAALDAKEKSNKAMVDATRKLEDEILNIQKESRQKALDQESLSHKRRLENLNQENAEILKENRKHQQEINNLSKEKNEAKTPEAKENYQKAIDARRAVLQKNNALISQNHLIATQMEQTHRYNLGRINEEWDGKDFQRFVDAEQFRLEKHRAILDEEIQKITTMDDAKLALKNMQHLNLTDQELRGIRTLEDAKKALRENADREVLKAQLKSLDEQKKMLEKSLEGLTGEAAEKLKANLDELYIRITQIKSAIQGGNENDEKKVTEDRKKELSDIDILGFSAEQWRETFDNLETTKDKIKAVHMVVQGLGNAFSKFAQLQSALNEREMRQFDKNQDKKKKELLIQLNEGYINQEEYHKGLQLLEEESANKKAEIAHKEARMKKAMDIASAISGTAVAVIGALGNKPWTPANIVLASVVGALGALQIGTIAAQPLPERPSFDSGGFTGPGYGPKDGSGFRPAGIVHQDEYVTPKWMLENPVIADVTDWMESIRTGRSPLPKSYAEGGHTTKNEPQISTANNETVTDDGELTLILQELKIVLSDLKANGVDAWMVEDAENGKRIKRTIKKFENIEQRNARRTQ